jgi:large subunit ribosomal protein L29
MAKTEDFKTKSRDELVKLLLDARKAQFNMRFQRAQGALENTAEIRKTRRNIARIKTFLNVPGAEGTTKKAAPAAKPAAAKSEKKTADKKPAKSKKTSGKAA